MSPPRKVHFSAIGGTGMVAGARLAVEAGWKVRGSDNPLYPPASEMVEALGVPVATGYEAKNLDWNPDIVVIGNVLSRGNPEVEAALSGRMHFMSLPEWLKEHVLRPRRPVVIAGTHGKTTTTALTAFVLDRCGLDPGYLIGGQPIDFDHSARLGPENAPFVIEGDEYDSAFFDKRAKFLHYLPEIAVVTSVEFDHGDIYPDLAAIETAFQRLLRQVPQEGWLLACADNAAEQLRDFAHAQVATYGFAPHADWRGEWEDGTLSVYRGNTLWAQMRPTLHGRHNLQNVLAAAAVAGLLGAKPEDVAAAIEAFQGVRRRMEVFLESRGALFVDDFAHHPTAIAGTIAAARHRWPDRRLRVLFEPRSNTTVTNQFQDALTDAFREADEVWLGPLYRAERIPESERFDRAQAVTALRNRNIEANQTDKVDDLVAHLQQSTTENDLVLILSNGAFGGIYEKLRNTFR